MIFSDQKAVASKILLARDAILNYDLEDAYHQLYSIADPEFESYDPWRVLEAIAEYNAELDGPTQGGSGE